MRGPTDHEVMQAMGRLKTRLQLAFPGSQVDVLGIADRANNLACWSLSVAKNGRTVSRAMRPDTPVETAVESIRAELEAAPAVAQEGEA